VMTHLDLGVISVGIAITVVAYWLAVGFYTAIPFLFPNYAARYRLQPTGRQMPMRRHVRMVVLTLFNQTILPLLFFFVVGSVYFYLGGELSLQLPTWPVMLWHIGVYVLVFEVLFYLVHRLLHTPYLFRTVHSLHHRFKAPVPYCGACVHPVEFVLAYIIPNVAAAIVFGFSFPEYVLFLSLEYVHNVHDHCGYAYPWDPFQFFDGQNVWNHNEHHKLIRVNYSGAFTMVLDKFMGTYRKPQSMTPPAGPLKDAVADEQAPASPTAREKEDMLLLVVDK
jgi:4-alpha-methyl-delta7-sterol-4alpha-methyl oxidase